MRYAVPLVCLLGFCLGCGGPKVVMPTDTKAAPKASDVLGVSEGSGGKGGGGLAPPPTELPPKSK